MSQYKQSNGETGEWLIKAVIVYVMVAATWITVVILELIHASKPDFARRVVFIRSRTNPGSAWSLDLHCSLHVLPFLPRLSWVNLVCTGEVFAMPTLLKLLTVSLASFLLDNLFYKGLAVPYYLPEKNI